MKGITKRFPGTTANADVDLEIHRGGVTALLGENGAGKSTLMNILSGMMSPDDGSIYLNDSPINFKSPRDAARQGIGMVHQHFMLIPEMTVLENVILGSEPVKKGIIDKTLGAEKLQSLCRQFGLKTDADAVVGDLPIGARQQVEIIKVLYRGADFLILDEPTAVLAPQETEKMFQIVEALKSRGKGIVFITHKLKEVFEIADHIVVLRKGRVVGRLKPQETDEKRLATLMVGRDISEAVHRVPERSREAKTVLQISDLKVDDDRGVNRVYNLILNVKAGEILGIAGVQGNGQTELAEAITGLRRVTEGQIILDGEDVTEADSGTLLRKGIAHIPEDRHRHGMISAWPVKWNLALTDYRYPPYSRGFIVDTKRIETHAYELLKKFDIQARDTDIHAASLSGGNQQKMVAARELSRPIKLLVASQPTRGLDVGSVQFIHQLLMKKREEGCAVILISSELDEIMDLSDRIAVMYRGVVNAVIAGKFARKEQLGLLMTGGTRSEVPGLNVPL